ncbi:MAG TPA: hypothetical protein DCQ15_06290 [Chitinophagaceae bacterium]|nr:hypothetical protein [Chitinophagaceae bacterium]
MISCVSDFWPGGGGGGGGGGGATGGGGGGGGLSFCAIAFWLQKAKNQVIIPKAIILFMA